MDAIELAYFDLILEENYSDDVWMKFTSYRGIDFYIRKDGHLQKRLKERYGMLSVASILKIVQKFIKKEISNKLSNSNLMTSEFPFTIFARKTNVYVSGRFKSNKGAWRCYIATVLPNVNAHHSDNDYFIELDE